MGKFCSLCGGKVGETCACGEGEPPAPQPQNQQDAAPDQQPVPFPGIPQPGVAPMWPPGYPVPHMGMQPPSHPATGLQCYICGVVCANKTVLGMHINECYKKHGEGRGAQHPMDVVMEGYTLFLNQKQAAHDAPPDAAVPNGAGLVAARMLQPPMYPMPGYAIPGLPSGHAYPMPHPVMLPGQFPGYAGGPYGMPMCYPQVPANPQPQAAPGPALAGEVERLTRELESLRQGKEEEYVQKQKQRTEAQVREGAPEAERRRLEQMQRDVQRDMEALKRQQAVQQAQEETARPAQPAQPTPPPRAPSPAHAPHRGYSEAPPPAAGDVSSASASSPAPVPVPVVPVRRFEEKSARPLSARSGDAQPGSAPPPAMPRRASSGGVKGVQNLKELLKQGSAGAPGPGVSAPTGPAEGKEMPGGKIQCTRCGREFGKKAFAVHAQGCGIDLRSRMSEKEGEEYDRQHNPDAEENKELSKQQIVKKRLAEEQAWQQFMVTYPRNVVQEEPLTQAERSNLKPNNPKGNGVECSRCGVTVPLAELDRHEAGCQGKKKPGAAPQAPPEALLPCAHCGRTFSPAALDRHESACQRQQAKKKAK
eukprot:TRINITY_DN3916_c0_g1_i1.p1 TRINITY_DN3916_c0_g1~~TRINITY_DN3916_c0_g1_i1.p1  ORF type:complete len:591 (+),score=121.84 TRINITY_DN3916_c0_g1_i1:994-2766(+)